MRDRKGNVRWLGAKAIPKLRTMVETEAESLRWTVQSALQLCYIIFESDSKCLVDALTDKEDWALLTMWKQDISGLASRLKGCHFMFTPRGGNKIADRIAKEALSFQNYVLNCILYRHLGLFNV